MFRLRQRLRRTGAVAVAAAAISLASAAPARADVAEYLGQPIASIRLVIDGHDTTEPALGRFLDVRVGDALSMRGIRETVLHLFAMGRFDDVRVDASRQGTGVAVRFDMTATRPVSEIRFAGNVREPGIDEGQLRKAVTERAGPSPTVTRVDELSRVVETALRTRGYLQARVSGRLEPSGTEHRALVFDLQPGTRTVVGLINVAGPEGARADFLAHLQTTSGTPFEREAVLARIEKYVAGRRGQGYYEAKVDLADQPADDGKVNLTFTVNPGRHVRVVFAGDSFPGDKRELVPVEREGSVDEDLLEDSTARIEDALKSQGYKDARAPHERADSNGELVITFRVARGQQYRIARVTFEGNASLAETDLAPALRIREGQPFSQASLEVEAGAIEDVYRRSGFGAAKAEFDVTPQPAVAGQVPVVVAIHIREGVRTIVRSVKLTGNASMTDATLLAGLRLQPGRPFVIASLAADQDAILVRYLNAGYENATVEPRPELNRDRTDANIVYAVREGPQVLVDHVLIVGPDRTDRSIVEKELRLHAGDPLSRDAVLDSQQRLRALGLYRSVSISELRHGEENRRDLLVSVVEGPGTSITSGGGFEVSRRVVPSDTGTEATDRLDAAPRGSFEISWRNLFGTNRSASVFSSLTLHPQGTKQEGVTEYRVVNTFREPKVFNTQVDGLITLTVEQQFRSSFNFRRKSATAEATRRLGGSVSLIGTYQIQKTEVYNISADQNLIDRVFPNVRLSSFSLSVLRDTRDDQIDPTKGQYFSAYGQLAARALGGEVGFFKSFFRASAFKLIPNSRGIVLAGNTFLGLATGFPQQDASGSTIVDANGEPARDLPQSERFYAGGDTTMRGFYPDQLGVRHTPPLASDTIDANGFPLGGNSELLFNVELRVPLWNKFETHGFLDTGNVFRRAVDLDLKEFRSAVGFGVLYKSPVGPLRFDLGFKVNPLPGESLTAFFVTFGRAF
jgi:outer membrane protein assembly complex protein YaeT